MRRFAEPQTHVPGAKPRMIKDEKTGLLRQERDKRGRLLWDMPDPVGTHETTQVVTKIVEVDGKPKQIRVKEKVSFPVYRGVSAKFARYMRSQFRRAQRKLEEQAALAKKQDAAAALRDFVLNPGGT